MLNNILLLFNISYVFFFQNDHGKGKLNNKDSKSNNGKNDIQNPHYNNGPKQDVIKPNEKNLNLTPKKDGNDKPHVNKDEHDDHKD